MYLGMAWKRCVNTLFISHAIVIQVSLIVVPKGSIDRKWLLALLKAWYRTGDRGIYKSTGLGNQEITFAKPMTFLSSFLCYCSYFINIIIITFSIIITIIIIFMYNFQRNTKYSVEILIKSTCFHSVKSLCYTCRCHSNSGTDLTWYCCCYSEQSLQTFFT